MRLRWATCVSGRRHHAEQRTRPANKPCETVVSEGSMMRGRVNSPLTLAKPVTRDRRVGGAELTRQSEGLFRSAPPPLAQRRSRNPITPISRIPAKTRPARLPRTEVAVGEPPPVRVDQRRSLAGGSVAVLDTLGCRHGIASTPLSVRERVCCLQGIPPMCGIPLSGLVLGGDVVPAVGAVVGHRHRDCRILGFRAISSGIVGECRQSAA